VSLLQDRRPACFALPGVLDLVDDLLLRHLENALLGDGKAADIASGISQKVPFRHLRGDVDVPPALRLSQDEVVELLRQIGWPQQSIAMRLEEIRADGGAPQVHDLFMVKGQGLHPAGLGWDQTSGGDHDVKVRIVVEAASEGVLYDDHVQAHPVLAPDPLLEHGGTQGWQIVLQGPMGLEDRPEDTGHGEDKANKRDIRQGGPLLSLPEQGAAIAAAGTALRFAGVVEDLLPGGGGVDLASQGSGAAHADLAEVLADEIAHGGVVPVLVGEFEDLPQLVIRLHLFRARRVFRVHSWSSPWWVRVCRSAGESSRTLPETLTSATRTACLCSEVIAASAPAMRRRSGSSLLAGRW